ncbi:MAG: hypothetical protein ACRDY6_09350 [Acidimicrobiia bacterium]
MPEQATTAADWKRDEPKLETLPSGNQAVLCRPQILTMVKRGDIPNPLAGAALRLADGALDGGDVASHVEVVDLLVAASFVEPTVSVEEPTNGELWVQDIDDYDKAYVLGRALGRVLELEPFREEPPSGADSSDRGDVRGPAE